jgi:phosphopantothenoylcysteine synthetase/decarboxylase
MAGPSVSLERLIDRLRGLDEATLSEISDFVEFIVQKKQKKGLPLLDAVRQRGLPSVTLQQVREDLSTIKGSLSDVVTQLRQERG